MELSGFVLQCFACFLHKSICVKVRVHDCTQLTISCVLQSFALCVFV